jgi:hypothetical protein
MCKSFDLRGSPEWETRTRYYFLSTGRNGGRFYCCIEEHESGDFNTDHRNGRWEEFGPKGSED